MLTTEKTYDANIFWDRFNDRAVETIQALKADKLPNIIRYAVHMTSMCNLCCTYCKEDKVGKIIDRNLFIDICHRAGKNGVVHITGGEPMLVPWLEEEIYNLREITRFALNTNLTILPNTKTLETVFRVKTSFDPFRTNRELLIKNIKTVSEIVPNTSITYTATHNTVDYLKTYILFAQLEFPKLYSFGVSFYKGNNTQLILTQQDITSLFKQAELLDTISKQVFMETHSIIGNTFPDNLKIPCYLSMSERLIDENGDEYYCSHLFRDKVKAPGNPGKDEHCVTGCNVKFNKFNKMIHEELQKEKLLF